MNMRTDNYFKHISDSFGNRTTSYMKDILKMEKKIVRFSSRLKFLLECRKNEVFPAHLQQHFNWLNNMFESGLKFERTLKFARFRFLKKVLSVEIKITIQDLSNFKHKRDILHQQTRTCIPLEIYEDFVNHVIRRNEAIDRISTTNTQRKLRKLIDKKCNRPPMQTQEAPSTFLNLTQHQIPENFQHLMGMGPKFSIIGNDRRDDVVKLLSSVETFLSNSRLPSEEVSIRRCNVANAITNYLHTYANNICTKSSDYFTSTFKQTKLFLKSNPDILILKSDKGNKTIAMSKSDYNQKLSILLNDNTTYEIMPNDPTNKYQRTITRIVNKLENTLEISPAIKKILVTPYPIAPRFYAQPKVHKDQVPLRPIVSFINAPTYNLCKFLANIINQINFQSPFSIKNSFDFVENIQKKIVPENNVLVSFDVNSLFTNIPSHLVLELISKNWTKLQPFTSISKHSFIELVKLCTDMGYFVHDNTYYKQIFGIAMGSPIAPALAELVMDDLLAFVTDKLDFELPFLYKYVDDIITILPKCKIDSTLLIFNSYHSRLNFTVEIENNNALPFLDTLVIREGPHIYTDWFFKPCASNRILHFYSQCPSHYKYNTLNNLLHRCFKISSARFHTANIERLKFIFINNDYPITVINKVIRQFKPNIDSIAPSNNNTNNNQLVTYFFSYPYIPYLSQKIKKMLTTPNCIPIFKPANSVGKLFTRVKDRIQLQECSNVIYKIPCNDCAKSYIGQTKRYLSTRLKEHKSNLNDAVIESLDTLTDNMNFKSALVSHAILDNHYFNFDNATVIDNENHLHKRLFLEAYHIYMNDTVNFRTDISNTLSTTYSGILNIIKNTK